MTPLYLKHKYYSLFLQYPVKRIWFIIQKVNLSTGIRELIFTKLELNYVNICCVNHEILPIDANMKRI